MATTTGDTIIDLTASDILSPKVWTPSPTRPTFGLDVTCTKISVEFQSMTRENMTACIAQNLDDLRAATATDAVFLARLTDDAKRIATVTVSKAMFAQCTPEVLKSDAIESYPWLAARLGHVRILEIRDTAAPRKEQIIEAERLRQLNIGSLLLIGYAVADRLAGFVGLASTRTREGWDVNQHLLLKLVGTSLATGFERIRMREHLEYLQERNDLALAGANDGLWDFDADLNTVYFSPRWKAMLGYAEDELNDSPDWRMLVHPDDLARVQSTIRDHVIGKLPLFESVHRLKHRDGEWRWVVSRAKARVDPGGRLRRIVCVELDITERKLYEEALFREKEAAQITLQSIGDGVITTDARSTIEYLNPVAEELTGWRLEDAQGRPIDEIFRAFHEETCEPLENPLSVSIRRTRSIKSVRPMLLIRRDGNELYVESTASPIRDGTGQVAGGVLVFHDVSEARELNRRLSYHASHDVLTGLVNRREFESRLDRALKSAKARETSYALCYLDIDQAPQRTSAGACASWPRVRPAT